jgi:hypothetical protein
VGSTLVVVRVEVLLLVGHCASVEMGTCDMNLGSVCGAVRPPVGGDRCCSSEKGESRSAEMNHFDEERVKVLAVE